jgi:hypothetical protein
MTESAMTITATLSAPPVVSAQRHTFVATGHGLVGLAAIKALKLAQLNITDALVFATGIAAHAVSHVVRQASQWAPVIPAVLVAGVLVTLAVAAGVDIVKLIADQPDTTWTAQSDGADRFVLRHLAWWHSRPIAKGLV